MDYEGNNNKIEQIALDAMAIESAENLSFVDASQDQLSSPMTEVATQDFLQQVFLVPSPSMVETNDDMQVEDERMPRIRTRNRNNSVAGRKDNAGRSQSRSPSKGQRTSKSRSGRSTHSKTRKTRSKSRNGRSKSRNGRSKSRNGRSKSRHGR
ncbi:hypothetical protein PVAND_009347 [Polypedilum vanderplanki]|uniref:Uncharacterized protein n=1 Tax=Polypedilum vanderplanki TaxID=319348 RepID=A0A9J6CCB9_POLVA|nr:hypothetical protein PVAND_009347 [Polypedilum vanderplanki]